MAKRNSTSCPTFRDRGWLGFRISSIPSLPVAKRALQALSTISISRQCLHKPQSTCGHRATLPASYIISGEISRADDGLITLVTSPMHGKVLITARKPSSSVGEFLRTIIRPLISSLSPASQQTLCKLPWSTCRTELRWKHPDAKWISLVRLSLPSHLADNMIPPQAVRR